MTDKTVVIHQPDFLPYLGFFHRLLHADLYVVLDTVQFLSGSKSWHNRDKIRTRQGEAWLTVPTVKAPRQTPINRIMIANDGGWRLNHLNLLNHNYRNAPFFKEIWPIVEKLYAGTETVLADFSLKSIKMLMELFDIRVEIAMASELAVEGKSNELLSDILQKTGATSYLSGVGARAYFDPAPFDRAGIRVTWQEFRHPEYPQLYSPFMPYMSSIDLFFTCGISSARTILRSC